MGIRVSRPVGEIKDLPNEESGAEFQNPEDLDSQILNETGSSQASHMLSPATSSPVIIGSFVDSLHEQRFPASSTYHYSSEAQKNSETNSSTLPQVNISEIMYELVFSRSTSQNLREISQDPEPIEITDRDREFFELHASQVNSSLGVEPPRMLNSTFLLPGQVMENFDRDVETSSNNDYDPVSPNNGEFTEFGYLAEASSSPRANSTLLDQGEINPETQNNGRFIVDVRPGFSIAPVELPSPPNLSERELPDLPSPVLEFVGLTFGVFSSPIS